MKQYNVYIKLLFGLIILWPLAGFADKVPKKFYPNNYVNTEKKNNEARYSIKPGLKKVEQNTANTKGSDTSQNKEGFFAEELAKESAEEEQSLSIEGIPVTQVGAILNSSDKEHYQNHLHKLIKTAVKYDIPISKIFTVGTPCRMKDDDDSFYLWLMEGLLETSYDAHQKYNVKLSPTWIISTADGEILLEGMGPLENFLNKKGEYVDKGFSEIAAEEITTREEGNEKKDT